MTRGQAQREFCDSLGLAKADLARWDELGKANILVGEAEASLGEARSKASGVKIETSEGR